jgi:hydrogenase nickel incorporation protein HypA/HybF
MHEMPFTQSILEMALKTAAGKPIRKIHLRVGQLSAIVPESVEVFFAYLSKDTQAEGASLVFEMVPITLTCRNCGEIIKLPTDTDSSPRQILAAAFRNGCPCTQGDFTVSDGLGFDLIDIDVEEGQ